MYYKNRIICIYLLIVVCIGIVAYSQDYALHFDGNDLSTIPHDSSISFSQTSSMTIELWFMRTSLRQVYHILGKRVSCGHSQLNYQLARDTASLLSFVSRANVVSTLTDPPLDEWMHMATTYDGSTLCIYLDGAIVVTVPNYVLAGENTTSLKLGDSGT